MILAATGALVGKLPWAVKAGFTTNLSEEHHQSVSKTISTAEITARREASRMRLDPISQIDLIVLAGLSFVSGFVDVTCFLGLFQTFVSFITGTLITLGSEIAARDPAIMTKLLVLVVFLPAASSWVFLIHRLRRAHASEITHYFLLVQAALLAGVMALGSLWSPLPGPDAWQTMCVAAVGVLTMSLQSVLMAVLLGFYPATTVMTMNTIKFIAHRVTVESEAEQDSDDAQTAALDSHMKRYGAAVTGFSTGVVLGAVCYKLFEFGGLFVPVLVLLFLSIRTARSRFSTAAG